MRVLKKSTAVTLLIGPFLDDGDGKSAETGLTISQADVRLSKNGGNMAQKHEGTSCTHKELGYYTCPLDTTDTGTLGILKIMVHESGALPVWHEYTVVPAAVYDSLVLGTDYLPVDVAEISSDSTAADNAELMFDGTGYAGGSTKLQVDTTLIEGSDATNQIRDSVVDDATRIDASALNTLSSHDPGATLGTADPGDAMTLTAAYDAAKTAAQAGDEMDLIDAPNATAVTAIQNGLAATGEAAAAVGGLHDFDPSAETVDVGAVAGVAVIGVDDFKADVSGLALTGEAAAAVVGLALTGEAASAVGTLNDLSAADVEDAVWDATLADHDDAGSTGFALAGAGGAGDPWGTALPGAYGDGTAGKILGTLNDLSAADVEDAVWDAATADHTDAGSMGVAVSSAGDPWSTALPGLYSAGTAGKLIGDNLDAKISTRSTLTAAQVWAAGSRTLTGFGTLVADVATAVWTAVARTITGGTVTTVGDKTGYALTAAYDAAQTAAQAAALATVAADVLRTLGLAQENQHIDNVTTDIYGRMTSARMRTYSAAGSVGTASDVLATYTITATYTGAEEAPTTYSVVRV